MNSLLLPVVVLVAIISLTGALIYAASGSSDRFKAKCTTGGGIVVVQRGLPNICIKRDAVIAIED